MKTKKIAEKEFTVINEMGLHVRPATNLSLIAGEYKDTDVFLIRNGNRVDAKIPLLILSLADICGSVFTIKAEGPNAEEVVNRIVEASKRSFDVEGD
jgi:phosphocarrier protein HPr